MPREPNLMESVQITLSTTTLVRSYLEDLVRRGTYGKNVAEAAERLVSLMITQKVADGEIRDRTPAGAPDTET